MLCVLLVDDEPEIRGVQADYCCRDPMVRVWQAENAEAAERIFLENPEITVVLTDDRMPGRWGRDFLLRIREELGRRQGRAGIMSGTADGALRNHCRLHGFACLEKPFSLEELRRFLFPSVPASEMA